MPTILEQAETIRDETTEYANTPERVGGCLVDIANALSSANALPYYFSYAGSNTQPTVITTGGTFYKAVTDLGVGYASGFSIDEFGVITCTYADAAGFYGMYNVHVVMSVSGASGSHQVTAALGSGTAVDDTISVVTTLANGAGNPTQIVMSFPFFMHEDDTLAIWLTDNHDGEELLVTNTSIAITRIATLAI